jgi:hypothetical protein
MKRLLLLSAALLCCATFGWADIVVTFQTLAPGDNPADFKYLYTADLTDATRLDNVNNGPDQNTGGGDDDSPQFFTIFDFAGYVPGTARAEAPNTALWTVSIQNTGDCGYMQACGPGVDDAGVTNITFTWNGLGGIQNGATNLGVFSADSTINVTREDFYQGQTTKTSPGTTQEGDITGNVGTTTVPGAVIPEPTSMGLMGLGIGSLAIFLKRHNKA